MSTNPKAAPYGSWQSPITSDLIVTQSISLSEVRFDGQTIYWLEARPQEEGRNVVVRGSGAGAGTGDILPKPFNVRTRVHEYGGGAWTVALGILYFSNFADGRLYRLRPAESEPAPLTPAPLTQDRQWRFADGIIDHDRHHWIGVREDHAGGRQPVNAIVALDLAQPGTAPGRIIANGHDFFASPRLSPDGRRLAWLAWDHPNMPWNGTTLYLAALDADGAIIGSAQRIAGGPAESIFQPEWSPDGTDLVFVSDRSGWWNLYRFTLATGAVLPIAPQTAEFGQPQWNFGMATYAFAGPDRIVCASAEAGLGHLAVIDLTTGSLRPLDTPFTQFASLRAYGDQVAFIAGAPSHPASVVVFDLSSGRYRVLKKATDILDRAELRIDEYLTSRSSSQLPPLARPSACFIDHAIPTMPRPAAKSRHYLSSAMVVRPQPPPRHSTSESSTGRAEALRCST